jgi:outer membrane protein TolC
MKKNFFAGLSVIFVLSAQRSAWPDLAVVLDLPNVVNAALKASPELQGAQAKIDAAKSNENEAADQALPHLNAVGNLTRGDNPVYAFSSLLSQRNFTVQDFNIASLNYPGYLNNIATSLQINLPLFTGFEIQSLKRAGKLGTRFSQSQKESLSQNLRFEVAQAYLQVLLDREMVDILSQRISSAEKKIEDAGRLKKAGLILGSDFYAASAIQSGLVARQLRAQRALENARLQLMNLMGSEDDHWTLKGQLPGRDYVILSRSDLIQKALSQRPELQGAVLGESIAQVLHRKEKLSFLPKVQAFAALDSNTSGTGALASDRMMGLQAQIPIADPAYFARKEKTRAQIHEASAEKEGLAQKIKSEVIRAFENYLGIQESLPVMSRTLDQAQKSLNLVGPLYREGRQSVIEALRAEEGVVHTEEAYLQTGYELHASYAQVLLTSGELGSKGIDQIARHLETGNK